MIKESKQLDAKGLVKYFKDEFKTNIKKAEIKTRTAGSKKKEIVNVWMKIDKKIFKAFIKHLCDYQFPHLAVVSGNDYPKEIELIDMAFSDPFTPPGSNEITGKIKNNSNRYVIDTLYLKVQLVDTYEDRSEIIGDDEVSILVDVPPEQTRDFIVHPNFGTFSYPKGKWDWLCSISAIKGVDPEYHTLMN